MRRPRRTRREKNRRMTVATLPAGGDGGHDLADPHRRVVTWGLAMPSAEDQWSIYTFQPDRAARPGPEFE